MSQLIRQHLVVFVFRILVFNNVNLTVIIIEVIFFDHLSLIGLTVPQGVNESILLDHHPFSTILLLVTPRQCQLPKGRLSRLDNNLFSVIPNLSAVVPNVYLLLRLHKVLLVEGVLHIYNL